MRTGFTAIELIVFVCEMTLGVTASVLLGNHFGRARFILGFIAGFAVIPGLFYGARGVHNARRRRWGHPGVVE